MTVLATGSWADSGVWSDATPWNDDAINNVIAPVGRIFEVPFISRAFVPRVERTTIHPFPNKDPNEVLDYVCDWSTVLQAGETITTATVSLSDGVIDSQSNTDSSQTVWISGGSGQAVVTYRILTSFGRTYERSGSISVVALSPFVFPRKDPDEVLDYKWDWNSVLQGSETVSTSSITVAGGIIEDSEEQTLTSSTIWLSGGSAGESYLLTCKVTTTEGRTYCRLANLLIAEL